MTRRGQKRISLPPNLGLIAADKLAGQFKEKQGSPLSIDAGKVEFVGGLGAQVLLSAKKTWERDNVPFRFSKISDACRTDLTLLGLSATFGLEKE